MMMCWRRAAREWVVVWMGLGWVLAFGGNGLSNAAHACSHSKLSHRSHNARKCPTTTATTTRSLGGRGRPGETGWRFLCLCFQYPNKRGRACLRPNTNKYTTSNQTKKKQCSRRLNAIYLTQKFRWCQRQEFACGSRVATNARARVLDRIPISFAGELARARIFWWQRANRRDAPRRDSCRARSKDPITCVAVRGGLTTSII